MTHQAGAKLRSYPFLDKDLSEQLGLQISTTKQQQDEGHLDITGNFFSECLTERLYVWHSDRWLN